jgi:hypothetical protein
VLALGVSETFSHKLFDGRFDFREGAGATLMPVPVINILMPTFNNANQLSV